MVDELDFFRFFSFFAWSMILKDKQAVIHIVKKHDILNHQSYNCFTDFENVGCNDIENICSSEVVKYVENCIAHDTSFALVVENQRQYSQLDDSLSYECHYCIHLWRATWCDEDPEHFHLEKHSLEFTILIGNKGMS